MNLAERLEYWVRWQPEAVAIRAAGTDVSWAELGERVTRVAGGLAARGVGVGDRVGILAMNSVEWCVLALATLHRGAVVVPLNIRLAPPELGQILAHSGCTLVAHDQALGKLFDAAPHEGIDAIALEELPEAEPFGLVERAEDDVAILGYTSGTTGMPKGVMLTHGNVAWCAWQTAAAEGSMRTRRTLLCIPLAFTGGIVNNFMSSFCVGGVLVLEPTFDPAQTLEIMERERITTWFAVPVMWAALTQVPGFAGADLSSLDTAITGGAPVPQALMRTYLDKDVKIRQAYGLTEATGSVTLLPAELVHRTEGAGRPNVHTRLELRDEEGNVVPPGEVGEICVRGPQVMKGYWDDEAATADALRDGWLHTGDMASWTEDDLLKVVDRRKSMFISGGLNVYPAEIERIVDSLPYVAEAACLGVPHERWGEACALVVVPGEGYDEEALLAHCREQLADYKVPRTVMVSDEPLPRGMSGKILRPEIKERYGGSAVSG